MSDVAGPCELREGKVNLDIIPLAERKTLQEKIFAKFVGTTFKNKESQCIDPCNSEDPVICFVRVFSHWESGSPQLMRHIQLFMMLAKFMAAMAATAEKETNFGLRRQRLGQLRHFCTH